MSVFDGGKLECLERTTSQPQEREEEKGRESKREKERERETSIITIINHHQSPIITTINH